MECRLLFGQSIRTIMDILRSASFVGIVGSVTVYCGSTIYRSLRKAVNGDDFRIEQKYKRIESAAYDIGKSCTILYLITSFFSSSSGAVVAIGGSSSAVAIGGRAVTLDACKGIVMDGNGMRITGMDGSKVIMDNNGISVSR